MLLLLPVFLVITGVLLTGSSGSPFFMQIRMGKGRKPFRIVKFRTMRAAAGDAAGRFDLGDSRRITRVGHLLRRTKLDELPQLWNVARGDMSLVGPRPEVERWTLIYQARWDKVLTIRPGITDPASIHFRNEEQLLRKSDDPERLYREVILPSKLDLYEQYIEGRSLIGDILILARTILVLFRR